WQRLTRLTLPMVSGFILINTILGFKGYLNAYDIIVGLTDGGPGTATSSIAMTIFKGFNGGDYGYQMANAAVFFLITLILAGIHVGPTDGGPGTATTPNAMAIFKGFNGGGQCYQEANGAVFFLVHLILAGIQLRLTPGKASFGARPPPRPRTRAPPAGRPQT